MKKTYIQPSLEEIRIQPSAMLAASVLGEGVFNENAGDDVIGLGHEDDFDFSDDNSFTFEEDNFNF